MFRSKVAKRSVSFRLPVEVLTVIDGIAKDNKTDRTGVIEFAIFSFLERIAKKNRKTKGAETRG